MSDKVAGHKLVLLQSHNKAQQQQNIIPRNFVEITIANLAGRVMVVKGEVGATMAPLRL